MALTHPLAGVAIERMVLRPTVALAIAQPAQPSPAGPVVPDSSAPVSMFVSPSVLGPATALAADLRRAWTEILRASVAADRLVDRARAADILLRMTREALEHDGALAAAFELSGSPPRLVPRRPLTSAAVEFPLAGIAFTDDRVAPRPLPTGERELYVPLADGHLEQGGLADAGVLLGRLQAGDGPAELAAFLATAPRVRNLFGKLVAVGLLGPAPARGVLDGALEPGQVLHLGHAGLVANLGGVHVAIDPWLPPASAGDAPPPPGIGDLPPLAAIFLTHHHWDHLHVETLLQLDKRTTIYVPAQPRGRVLSPQSDRLLRYLGFVDVRPLAHGEEVALGDGGRVVAAPFHGEDPTVIDYAGNCYLLAHGGAAGLVHVDSAIDRHGRSLWSTGVLAALRDRFGPLSPVFATRRQERRTMIDYTWEGLLQPVSAWVAPTENCVTGADALAALCEHARTKALVLYSEGGSTWYPAGTNFLPGDRPAAAEPYQLGWDSLEQIFDRLEALGVDTIVSKPYQRYTLGAGAAGWVTPRPHAARYGAP
ncbi:MAG TPA: MBL fold metallo-hydrolase [Kofleriaceae bacterium]|nr:MBL fold metallo-hydrolase [Kofleriaceae bacterium]